jgi:hypothetical protein
VPISPSYASPAGFRWICRDPWLEMYCAFIERLHKQSGSGPVSGHYLAVAIRAYGLYCQSCDQFHQRAAWAAIQMGCQWCCQRQGNN